jgi:hypothetical protein
MSACPAHSRPRGSWRLLSTWLSLLPTSHLDPNRYVVPKLGAGTCPCPGRASSPQRFVGSEAARRAAVSFAGGAVVHRAGRPRVSSVPAKTQGTEVGVQPHDLAVSGFRRLWRLWPEMAITRAKPARSGAGLGSKKGLPGRADLDVGMSQTSRMRRSPLECFVRSAR